MRRLVLLAAFSSLSLLAGGCMVGPKYAPPVVEQPIGFKSQPGSEASPPIAADWWRLYADPELDRLIATAQAANQTLGGAVARVDEARALARVAGSFLYPTVSLDPSYARTRYSGARASTITAKQVPRGVDISSWTIPLDLSYEVDVWGRVRRSLEAARATAAATEDDVGVVRLTIETDVAEPAW
jgi:multidrug efflux system outer membrane protein